MKRAGVLSVTGERTGSTGQAGESERCEQGGTHCVCVREAQRSSKVGGTGGGDAAGRELWGGGMKRAALKEGYIWRTEEEGSRVKEQRKGKSKMGQDNAVSGMIH